MSKVYIRAIFIVEGSEDANIYPIVFYPHTRFTNPIYCPDPNIPRWRNIIYVVSGRDHGESISFSPAGGKSNIRNYLNAQKSELESIIEYFVIRGEEHALLQWDCYLPKSHKKGKLKVYVKRPLHYVVLVESLTKISELYEEIIHIINDLVRDIKQRYSIESYQIDRESNEDYVHGGIVVKGGLKKLIHFRVHVIKGCLDEIIYEIIGNEAQSLLDIIKRFCSHCRGEKMWKCYSNILRVIRTCTCSYREHAKYINNTLNHINNEIYKEIMDKYGLNKIMDIIVA